MNAILLAARLAENGHRGQTRKFTGRPYIEHPGRVASRISRHRFATEDMVVAAWLHDTIEDCGVTSRMLVEAGVAHTAIQLVEQLTNPSKKRDDLNREERKTLDREHLTKVSRDAKMIKLADRADNLREIDLKSSEGLAFAKTYVQESTALLLALRYGADLELEQELLTLLQDISVHLRSL